MHLIHSFFAATGACGSNTTILDTSCLPNHAPHNTVATVLSIVFAIAASVSLLMIVIGGLRYVLAHGEPNDVSSAKNTILYAIIGLIVTLSAFSIVTFVLGGVL